MSAQRRILFVVPPFASHVYPTVAIAAELAARGHAVAWVGYSELASVLPTGAALYSLPMPVAEEQKQALTQAAGVSFMSGMKAFFEQIVFPMAGDMLPGVEAAIADFRPDALVADQMTFAGPLAARRHNLRWATSATTGAIVHDSFAPFAKVEEWLVEHHARIQRDAGLVPRRWLDRSPALVLFYFSRLLCGLDREYPPQYRFVGPVLSARQELDDFPWSALRDGKRVYVSLGTAWVERGERFFRIVAEALSGQPIQVVVSAPSRFFAEMPENFIVRPWVPATRLYPRVDAVVTHAGTTVNEAIAHGLPAVVAPIVLDQFIFAEWAVRGGAARRISFNRMTASDLRDALMAVLHDPAYRTAAERLQASFREAGGERAAAEAIEALCAAPAVT